MRMSLWGNNREHIHLLAAMWPAFPCKHSTVLSVSCTGRSVSEPCSLHLAWSGCDRLRIITVWSRYFTITESSPTWLNSLLTLFALTRMHVLAVLPVFCSCLLLSGQLVYLFHAATQNQIINTAESQKHRKTPSTHQNRTYQSVKGSPGPSVLSQVHRSCFLEEKFIFISQFNQIYF